MTDTFESDLHIIEHVNIHQHLLKQYLHFQKSPASPHFFTLPTYGQE